MGYNEHDSEPLDAHRTNGSSPPPGEWVHQPEDYEPSAWLRSALGRVLARHGARCDDIAEAEAVGLGVPVDHMLLVKRIHPETFGKVCDRCRRAKGPLTPGVSTVRTPNGRLLEVLYALCPECAAREGWEVTP